MTADDYQSQLGRTMKFMPDVAEVTVEAQTLDAVGRVIDFSVIKERVGGWIDATIDHGMVLEQGDPMIAFLEAMDPPMRCTVLDVPPTAENIAEVIFNKATELLHEPWLKMVGVRLWETPNCYVDVVRAAYSLPPPPHPAGG